MSRQLKLTRSTLLCFKNSEELNNLSDRAFQTSASITVVLFKQRRHPLFVKYKMLLIFIPLCLGSVVIICLLVKVPYCNASLHGSTSSSQSQALLANITTNVSNLCKHVQPTSGTSSLLRLVSQVNSCRF